MRLASLGKRFELYFFLKHWAIKYSAPFDITYIEFEPFMLAIFPKGRL